MSICKANELPVRHKVVASFLFRGNFEDFTLVRFLPLGHCCTWPMWPPSGRRLLLAPGVMVISLADGAGSRDPPAPDAPFTMAGSSQYTSQGTTWHYGFSSRVKQSPYHLTQTHTPVIYSGQIIIGLQFCNPLFGSFFKGTSSNATKQFGGTGQEAEGMAD